MKRSLVLTLACSIAVVLATGCRSNPKKSPVTSFGNGTSTTQTGGNTGQPTQPPGNENTIPVGPKNDTTTTTTAPSMDPNEQGDRKGLDGMVPDREAFKAQTVYFDFDSATIKPNQKKNIDTVAKALKDQKLNKIQIEGHCDERGTEEYNRALGEKRALAIREYMMSQGVEGTRVFTLSFGEDKPAAQGHSESVWSKNRRGEFILYRPKP